MKKHKVSAETREKSIKDADLGVGAWALRIVRAVAAFRTRRSGKVATGEIVYRTGQAMIGLLVALLVKSVFGVPASFLSGLVLACVLFGSQFGAVRFLFFSLLYWGIVGTGLGITLGAWPLSPSWWRTTSEAFAGQQTGLWPVVGGLLLSSVVWVAGGRLAAKGIGLAAIRAIETWTFERSQEVQKRRSDEIDEEFVKVGVTRGEVDELSRRDEADRRRAVVFGGGVRRRRTEGVSLSKTDEPEAVDPTETARRVADLAGHVDDKDIGVLAGLTSGPAFDDMLGGDSTPPATNTTSRAALVNDADDDIPGPSARSSLVVDEDDDIPGPSARASLVVDQDDDIPGPSARAVRDAEEPAPSSVVVMHPVEKLEQPVPAVSAPRVNPEASRGRRRLSREDLSKMIDIFNFMSREDNLELFVNSTRSKLIRLTDEDYEELRTLEGGDILITMSQDLKLADQSRGRTAVSERQKQADEFMTGNTSKMATSDAPSGPSAGGSMLASALSLVHTAASGRASLGVPGATRTPPPPPPQGEQEDFSDESLPVAAEDASSPVPEPEPRPTELSSPAIATAAFVDPSITDSESLDPNMRRLPTTYASERVSILNNAALSDDQKLDRIRTLDRSHGVSTMEMFAGDEVANLLNLPSKVMISLREKVVLLMGERPSDMVALQALFDRRVELGQKDLFDDPQEHQRILSEFVSLAAEVHDMSLRIDSPQSRDLLDHSMRLDPWFEQNLEGVRSGRITSPLPVPKRGPGVFDRISGTVQAALRGAGMPTAAPAPAEVERPAAAPARTPSHLSAAPSPSFHSTVATTPVVDVAAPYAKGVDSQWASRFAPGTDEYMVDMAEHFAMMVKRNAERVEQAERERVERIDRERREEDERLARIALADKRRRESEFFASLPETDAPTFVTTLATRFMSDAILSEIAAIVEGHAMASRMQKENASSRARFVDMWTSAHGTPPDRVDELAAPGERFQVEIALRNGGLARRVLEHVAEECGLPADASRDEIAARLTDDEENEFARRIDLVIERADDMQRALDVARQREDAAIAAAVSRDRVSSSVTDAAPEDASEAAERARTESTEIETLRERASAAEAEARAARAAASDMKQKVEDLEARVASPKPASDETEAAPSVPSSTVVDQGALQVGAFLAEHLQTLDVKLELGTYTSRIQGGILVVIDLPDDLASANRMSVAGRQQPLVDVLARWVLRPAAAVHPDLDIAQIVLITDGPISSDVTDAGLGMSDHTLEVCRRELVPIDRILRAFGAVE